MTRALLALLVSILVLAPAALPALSAEGRVLRVPQEYPTIQAAVNAALPGDTILVSPGTYNESITIDVANITITGNATIKPPPGRPGIVVAAPNTRIQGLTITASNAPAIQVNLAPTTNTTLINTTLQATGAPALRIGPLIAQARIHIAGSKLTGTAGITAKTPINGATLEININASTISCMNLSTSLARLTLNIQATTVNACTDGSAVKAKNLSKAEISIREGLLNGSLTAKAYIINTAILDSRITSANTPSVHLESTNPISGTLITTIKNTTIKAFNTTAIKLINSHSATISNTTITGNINTAIKIVYNPYIQNTSIKINNISINRSFNGIIIYPVSQLIFPYLQSTIYILNSTIRSSNTSLILISRTLNIINSTIKSYNNLILSQENIIVKKSVITSTLGQALRVESRTIPWSVSLSIISSVIAGEIGVLVPAGRVKDMIAENSTIVGIDHSILIDSSVYNFSIFNSTIIGSIYINEFDRFIFYESTINSHRQDYIIRLDQGSVVMLDDSVVYATNSSGYGLLAEAENISISDTFFGGAISSVLDLESTGGGAGLRLVDVVLGVDGSTLLVLGSRGALEVRGLVGDRGSVSVSFFAESALFTDVSLPNGSAIFVNPLLPVEGVLREVRAVNVSIGGLPVLFLEGASGGTVRADGNYSEVFIYSARDVVVEAGPGVGYVLVVSSRNVSVIGPSSGSVMVSNSSEVRIERFSDPTGSITVCCGSSASVYLSILKGSTVRVERNGNVTLYSPWPLTYRFGPSNKVFVNYLGNYWVDRARAPIEDRDGDGIVDVPVSAPVGRDLFPLRDVPASYTVFGRPPSVVWIDSVTVTGRVISVVIIAQLRGSLTVFINGSQVMQANVTPGRPVVVTYVAPWDPHGKTINVTAVLVDAAGGRHVAEASYSVPRQEPPEGPVLPGPPGPDDLIPPRENSGGDWGGTGGEPPGEESGAGPVAIVLAAVLAVVVGAVVGRVLARRP